MSSRTRAGIVFVIASDECDRRVELCDGRSHRVDKTVRRIHEVANDEVHGRAVAVGQGDDFAAKARRSDEMEKCQIREANVR